MDKNCFHILVGHSLGLFFKTRFFSYYLWGLGRVFAPSAIFSLVIEVWMEPVYWIPYCIYPVGDDPGFIWSNICGCELFKVYEVEVPIVVCVWVERPEILDNFPLLGSTVMWDRGTHGPTLYYQDTLFYLVIYYVKSKCKKRKHQKLMLWIYHLILSYYKPI